MIERPIKKSDRQAVPQSNDVIEKVIQTESLEERKIILLRKDNKMGRKEPPESPEPPERQERQTRQERPERQNRQERQTRQEQPERQERQTRQERPERQNRQERQTRQKEEFSSRTPVNPALVRGPKPTKPKPPVIPALNEATEADAIEPAT